jgi:aldehyde dehydrogenase (NAD+)
MKQVFDALELTETNPGAFCGDGGWLKSNGTLIESINPATGKIFGRVHAASAADYENVIASARAVFDEWRRVPAPKRGDAVRLVGDELRKLKDALGTLVSLETGKIKPEGDGEVQEMIDIADFAVGQSRMLYGSTMHSERPQHRMYEQWHPLGVVGIISAFNFPVAVWSWNAFLAAICGDVCIWKPSQRTPLCGIAVQRLANRVLERNGFPAIFQLFIDADNQLAEKFVEDRRVDLVSFTGSTQVGRGVAQKVAARLGKSLLELGGNNAIIVDEFANLDLAVPRSCSVP